MENKNMPAFSQSSEWIKQFNNGYFEPCGLTKREYFAALAMQGMSNLVKLHIDPVKGCCFENTEMIAQMSVAVADALLAELEKEIKQ